MAADARADGVRIAQRYRRARARYSNSAADATSSSSSCFGALLRCECPPLAACVATCGIRRHRAPVGRRDRAPAGPPRCALHRRVLRRLGRRPAVVPDRLPVQVGALGQVGRIDQPLGEHPLVDRIVGSAPSSDLLGDLRHRSARVRGSCAPVHWLHLVPGGEERGGVGRRAALAAADVGRLRAASARRIDVRLVLVLSRPSSRLLGRRRRPTTPGCRRSRWRRDLRCGNNVTGSSECPLRSSPTSSPCRRRSRVCRSSSAECGRDARSARRQACRSRGRRAGRARPRADQQLRRARKPRRWCPNSVLPQWCCATGPPARAAAASRPTTNRPMWRAV